MDRRKKTRKVRETSVATSSQKYKDEVVKKKSGNTSNKTPSSTNHLANIFRLPSFAHVDWSLTTFARRGILLAFFLFVWWFCSYRYSDLLYVTGSQEGFYLEWQTLTGCLTYISLPLELVTSFIMQLFLFPTLGGLAIALLAAILVVLAAKHISPGPWGIIFAIGITLFLFCVMTRQGYYVFGYRSFVFFFQAFVGLVIVFALATGYAKCPRGWLRIVYAITSVVLFYPLIGSFALCTAMYELKTELDEIRTESSRRSHESMAAFLTLLTLVTPLLWYPLYSGRIPVCMLYSHNFCYREITLADINSIMLNRVYGGILAFLLMFPVFCATMYFLYMRRKRNIDTPRNEIPERAGCDMTTTETLAALTDKATGPEQTQCHSTPLGSITAALVVCCLFVLAIGFAKHDKIFMTSLAMWRPFENRQWDKIIELEGKLQVSILPLIELRRQAQLETGQLAQDYFGRGYKYETTHDLIEISSFQIYGMELLILNGNINHGYRTAMNCFQFRRNQSPRLMKILFMGALVNEEYALAKRYLDRLKKVPFRNKWCQTWETVLDYCSQYDEDKDRDKLASLADNAMQNVKHVYLMRSLRPDTDYIGGDNTHYYPCITFAARFRNIENIPRPWQEQQLLHVLVLRDFKLFRSKFATYYKGLVESGITEVPEVFQAGLLYCHFIDTGRCENPPDFTCSPALILKFRDYALHMSRYEQTHDQTTLKLIDTNYNNTCWYAIDFGQDYMLY